MGADHVGVTRLLYHIQREMPEYLALGKKTPSFSGTSPVPGRAHHVRVPRCAPTPIDALALWGEFLQRRMPGGVPLWAICPLQGQWIDLLVGSPTERELLCIRVPPSELPLITDVPYQIDADFVKEVRAEIAATLGKTSDNKN